MKITLSELKQIIRQEVRKEERERERERDDVLNEGLLDFFRGLKGTIGLKIAKFAINYILSSNKYKEKDLTPYQRKKMEEYQKEIEENLNNSISKIGQILNSEEFVNKDQTRERIMSNKLSFEDFQIELSNWKKAQGSGLTSVNVNTVKLLCDYFGIDDEKIENKSKFMNDLFIYIARHNQTSKDQVIYQLMKAMYGIKSTIPHQSHNTNQSSSPRPRSKPTKIELYSRLMDWRENNQDLINATSMTHNVKIEKFLSDFNLNRRQFGISGPTMHLPEEYLKLSSILKSFFSDGSRIDELNNLMFSRI